MLARGLDSVAQTAKAYVARDDRREDARQRQLAEAKKQRDQEEKEFTKDVVKAARGAAKNFSADAWWTIYRAENPELTDEQSLSGFSDFVRERAFEHDRVLTTLQEDTPERALAEDEIFEEMHTWQLAKFASLRSQQLENAFTGNLENLLTQQRVDPQLSHRDFITYLEEMKETESPERQRLIDSFIDKYISAISKDAELWGDEDRDDIIDIVRNQARNLDKEAIINRLKKPPPPSPGQRAMADRAMKLVLAGEGDQLTDEELATTESVARNDSGFENRWQTAWASVPNQSNMGITYPAVMEQWLRFQGDEDRVRQEFLQLGRQADSPLKTFDQSTWDARVNHLLDEVKEDIEDRGLYAVSALIPGFSSFTPQQKIDALYETKYRHWPELDATAYRGMDTLVSELPNVHSALEMAKHVSAVVGLNVRAGRTEGFYSAFSNHIKSYGTDIPVSDRRKLLSLHAMLLRGAPEGAAPENLITPDIEMLFSLHDMDVVKGNYSAIQPFFVGSSGAQSFSTAEGSRNAYYNIRPNQASASALRNKISRLNFVDIPESVLFNQDFADLLLDYNAAQIRLTEGNVSQARENTNSLLRDSVTIVRSIPTPDDITEDLIFLEKVRYGAGALWHNMLPWDREDKDPGMLATAWELGRLPFALLNNLIPGSGSWDTRTFAGYNHPMRPSSSGSIWEDDGYRLITIPTHLLSELHSPTMRQIFEGVAGWSDEDQVAHLVEGSINAFLSPPVSRGSEILASRHLASVNRRAGIYSSVPLANLLSQGPFHDGPKLDYSALHDKVIGMKNTPLLPYYNREFLLRVGGEEFADKIRDAMLSNKDREFLLYAAIAKYGETRVENENGDLMIKVYMPSADPSMARQVHRRTSNMKLIHQESLSPSLEHYVENMRNQKLAQGIEQVKEFVRPEAGRIQIGASVPDRFVRPEAGRIQSGASAPDSPKTPKAPVTKEGPLEQYKKWLEGQSDTFDSEPGER
jgi:hypothetical protein